LAYNNSESKTDGLNNYISDTLYKLIEIFDNRTFLFDEGFINN